MAAPLSDGLARVSRLLCVLSASSAYLYFHFQPVFCVAVDHGFRQTCRDQRRDACLNGHKNRERERESSTDRQRAKEKSFPCLPSCCGRRDGWEVFADGQTTNTHHTTTQQIDSWTVRESGQEISMEISTMSRPTAAPSGLCCPSSARAPAIQIIIGKNNEKICIDFQKIKTNKKQIPPLPFSVMSSCWTCMFLDREALVCYSTDFDDLSNQKISAAILFGGGRKKK